MNPENDPLQPTPPEGLGTRLQHADSEGLASSRAIGSGSRPSGYWEPPAVEALQALLPQYEFLNLLGRGGMGAVYQARQKSLKRLVAIKVLPGDVLDANDANFVQRFQNEAETMGRMNHPGIVNVYDFGEATDAEGKALLYFVMEYVEGTDVAQMVKSTGRLPPEHAFAITAHVCDALAYAHSHGVIHRDIKPANVLINLEGQVKVADFGLAKAVDTEGKTALTRTDMAMGTPDYVAPEALVLGMHADHRADLYAVGVMLYNMLTGEIPRGMFQFPSEKVGTDWRFDEIIRKAMQADRERRYQSADEIRQALDVILTTPMVRKGDAASLKVAALEQGRVGRGSVEQAVEDQKRRHAAALQDAPRKSWLLPGILGGVAVLGAAVFLLLRKSPEAEGLGVRGRDRALAGVPDSPSTSIRPTAPDPAPSAPLPVSNPESPPAPSFPPGQWVKVFTKIEDLPEDLRKKAIRFEGGWLQSASDERCQLPLGFAGNYGIRVRLVRVGGSVEERSDINLRASSSGSYFTFLSANKLMIQRGLNGQYSRLASREIVPMPRSGDEYTLEFACLGTRLVSRFNGAEPLVAQDSSHGEGRASVYFVKAVRDIEVINLDGLPEAEALRLLGLDENGNNRNAAALPLDRNVPALPTSPEVAGRLGALAQGFAAAFERDFGVPPENGLEDLRGKYLKLLQDARQKAQSGTKLQEALAIKAEIAAVEARQALPAVDAKDLPASLAGLRAAYRGQLAKRTELYGRYEGALATYVAELTQAGKLEEAHAVKQQQEKIAAAGAMFRNTAVPAVGVSGVPPAASSTEPGRTAVPPKGNDREAAR